MLIYVYTVIFNTVHNTCLLTSIERFDILTFNVVSLSDITLRVPWEAAQFSSGQDLLATVPIIHTITARLRRLISKRITKLSRLHMGMRIAPSLLTNVCQLNVRTKFLGKAKWRINTDTFLKEKTFQLSCDSNEYWPYIFLFKTKNFTQSFWSYRIVMIQVEPNLPPIYLYLRQKLSQFSH